MRFIFYLDISLIDTYHVFYHKKYNGPVQISPPENLNFFTTRPLLSGKWTVFQWDWDPGHFVLSNPSFSSLQLCHHGRVFGGEEFVPFCSVYTQIPGWLGWRRRLVGFKMLRQRKQFLVLASLCCQLTGANTRREIVLCLIVLLCWGSGHTQRVDWDNTNNGINTIIRYL